MAVVIKYFMLGCFVLVIVFVKAARTQNTPQPRFLDTETNITVQVGHTARLPCAVADLGTKTVLWRRVNQAYPISIGNMMFSPDRNFNIEHKILSTNTSEWNLLIIDVGLSPRYAGMYECGVNTLRRIAKRVRLNVIDGPEVQIEGTPYVERGSVLTLTCHCPVSRTHTRRLSVDWFKDGERITPSTDSRVEISAPTSREGVISVLIVRNSTIADGGLYVCRCSNLLTSYKVMILNRCSKPVKDWYGVVVTTDITLSEFYSEFADGKFDTVMITKHRHAAVQVLAGKSKCDLTNVSSVAKLSSVVPLLGPYLKFVLQPEPLSTDSEGDEVPTVTTVLMAAARSTKLQLPPEFSQEQRPSKNRLKNDIIQWLHRNSLGWSKDSTMTLGLTFVQTLGDALWYIDQNHDTLNRRCCTVPVVLQQFSGYRNPEKMKKRKINEGFLKNEGVQGHSSALFNLALASYMKTDEWKSVKAAVLDLANSLQKYGVYLTNHAKRVKEDHLKLFKAPNSKDCFKVLYKSFPIHPTAAARYGTLHEALLLSKDNTPLFLTGFAPADPRRRFEFLNELKVPCKAVLYTHSGSGPSHLHFLWKVSEFSETEEILNDASSISKVVAADLPKFHSRAQRKEFVDLFGRMTKCNTGFLREAYHRLTGDASAPDTSKQAEVDARIRKVLDEEDPELIWDLRSGNQGRPEQYSVFLEKCQSYISSSVETAVDDRRHDNVHDGDVITHLACALSVRDLHDQVAKMCTEETPIPSIQWLRLQFWPKRPCAKTASRYTGKLKVKHMVQARQLRADHIDAHYASAIFRYQREFSVKFREHASFVSLDDKHTVKVGEPGCPVASVERGKRVIVAMGKTFAVSDHDFTRLSLTPSVSLLIDVPESIDESFHRGRVSVILKENCFQPSSAIRHMTELGQLLQRQDAVKPVLLIYTDGGPDHRLTYLTVQISLIAIFLDLDFDAVIAVRTPPGHSWKNPVERIMSIINLSFQGIGIMREECPDHETELKRCSSLKSIRVLASKIPEVKEEVLECVQPAKELMTSMIRRQKLKDHFFESTGPATDDEMQSLWENILKVDDSMTTDIRTKLQVQKKEHMEAFMESHCKKRQYMFSVMKCGDSACTICKPPRLPKDVFSDLHHLPDPVPDGNRYRSFDVLYGKNTTEEYLPSIRATAEKGHKCPFNPTAQTAKCVGVVIECQECGKWRCLHAKKKLTRKQREDLEVLLETLIYSCGSIMSNIDDDEEGDSRSVLQDVYVRANMTCNTDIELTYYSAGYELICIHCGTVANLVEKDGFYPQCPGCVKKKAVSKRCIKKQ